MACTFTDLPEPMIACILAALPDLGSLSSTIRASRYVYHVWQSNQVSISRSILQRSAPCPDQAVRLAATQERQLGLPETSRTQRVVRNANLAHKVCEAFVRDVVSYMRGRFRDPFLHESERLRVCQTFYDVWTKLHHAVPAYRQQHRQRRSCRKGERTEAIGSGGEETPLRSLHRCHEMVKWMMAYCDSRAEIQRAMMAPFGLADGEGEPIWLNAMDKLHGEFTERHERVTGRTGRYIPDGAPLGLFTFFDEFQDVLEMDPIDA